MVCNQVTARGLIALKFFIVATLLGPKAIGLAGVGLLAIAIVESLTDTGLPQAVIQKEDAPSCSTLNAVFVIQALRGGLVGSILFFVSYWVEIFLDVDGAGHIVALASLSPILKGIIFPSYFMAQRDRNFRGVATVEMLTLSSDLGFTMFFYMYGLGASSIIMGLVCADALKVILVGSFFRFELSKPNWITAKELTKFGRWIWGVSIITMIINQFDRVIIAKMLGVSTFGGYQMATKAGQLFYVDVATMISQYLFPVLSRKCEKDRLSAFKYFARVLLAYVFFSLLMSLFLYFLLRSSVMNYMPKNWADIFPIVLMLIPMMLLSGFNSIFSSYWRANGMPKVTMIATLVQGAIALPLVYLLCQEMQLDGVILGNTIALSSSAAIFVFYMYKLRCSLFVKP